jgi:hypothetical protein
MNHPMDGAHHLRGEGARTHAGKRTETLQPGGDILECGRVNGGTAARVAGVKSVQNIRNLSTSNLSDDEP